MRQSVKNNMLVLLCTLYQGPPRKALTKTTFFPRRSILRYGVLQSAVMIGSVNIFCGQRSTVQVFPVSMMFGVAVGYILTGSGATATGTKVELNHIRRPQAPGMLGLCELLTN